MPPNLAEGTQEKLLIYTSELSNLKKNAEFTNDNRHLNVEVRNIIEKFMVIYLLIKLPT